MNLSGGVKMTCSEFISFDVITTVSVSINTFLLIAVIVLVVKLYKYIFKNKK